jgi:L-ascorbate metabolism protein UlaG (beta-lactamase superfamily)
MSFTFTWYGHGTFGLLIGEHKIVVDPFFTDNPAASTQLEKVEAGFILISHGHGDHVGDAEALAKQTGAQVIANAEISDWLAEKGVNTHAQHIGGSHQHVFGSLKFTMAVHGSGLPDGSDGGNPVGFLVTTPGRQRIYMACDTGLFSDMQMIGEDGLDLAVLPIGDNYTMGPDDALKAVKLLKPKHAIPVHYNTWPLIEQDSHAWAEQVQQSTQTIPHVLQPGETFSL